MDEREQERLDRALEIAQNPSVARKIVDPAEVAPEGPPDLRTRAIPVPEEES